MLFRSKVVCSIVGVGEGDGFGVDVAVGVGNGVLDELGIIEGFAVGFAIRTPLFQIKFLPDLMQVNFFPEAVAV